MKKNKKVIAAFLSVFSGFSLVNAGEKNKNIKVKQQKCDFKKPEISKNKNSETLSRKISTANNTKLAICSFTLLLSVPTAFLFKDRIANFLGNNQKKESDVDNKRIPNKEQEHPQQYPIHKLGHSSIDDIKFSNFEKLVFDDSMVTKINTSGSEISKYYPKCQETHINYNDPGSIMGKSFDEKDMRSNPRKYFFQDQDDYIYVKDMNGQLHCTGKMIVPSLKDLLEQSKNINNNNGTVNIVYGNTDLLDIHNVLDSGIFQLANPASNFNAIETLGSGDFNKCFKSYNFDHTQGPWFMKKCPWSSFPLLHVLNGIKISSKNSPVTNEWAKNLFQIINGQFEFNLLGDYGIKTSAGYVASNLPNDFSNPNKDELYRSLIIENAPVSLQGKRYIYSGDTTLIDIYIDAAIPKSYGTSSYEEKDIKQHLFRHYMSIISYCKLKEIKNAILSLTGCGVFNVPIDWHLEILSDKKIQNAIKASGTNFIINGYGKCVKAIKNKSIEMIKWTEVIKTHNKINCVNIDQIDSWEGVFTKLGINKTLLN